MRNLNALKLPELVGKTFIILCIAYFVESSWPDNFCSHPRLLLTTGKIMVRLLVKHLSFLYLSATILGYLSVRNLAPFLCSSLIILGRVSKSFLYVCNRLCTILSISLVPSLGRVKWLSNNMNVVHLIFQVFTLCLLRPSFDISYPQIFLGEHDKILSLVHLVRAGLC